MSEEESPKFPNGYTLKELQAMTEMERNARLLQFMDETIYASSWWLCKADDDEKMLLEHMTLKRVSHLTPSQLLEVEINLRNTRKIFKGLKKIE